MRQSRLQRTYFFIDFVLFGVLFLTILGLLGVVIFVDGPILTRILVSLAPATSAVIVGLLLFNESQIWKRKHPRIELLPDKIVLWDPSLFTDPQEIPMSAIAKVELGESARKRFKTVARQGRWKKLPEDVQLSPYPEAVDLLIELNSPRALLKSRGTIVLARWWFIRTPVRGRPVLRLWGRASDPRVAKSVLQAWWATRPKPKS